MQATVKRTGLGHGESGTCRYIGDDEKQAHNLTQLRQRYANDPAKLAFINRHDTKRNIALAGIGVRTCGWKFTARDFHRLSHFKPHNKVKTINIVISPQRGTVDPHNLEQVEQFKQFCINYGKTVFPHHKIYIAVQHDNKGGKRSRGGITHAHLIVSSLSTLPPHNALRGYQYDNHHLRHWYNVLADKFNRQQSIIQLGSAVYTKHQRAPKPSVTEDWLARQSVKPLDKLEAGKLTNKTAIKHAFRSQGITVKFSKHRHRKYLTDKDGNLAYHTDKRGRRHKIPLYHKYTSGKRKGQYMYRKNRHGNKSKIPLYTYSAGMTLKPLAKNDNRPKRKRRYIRGSRMEHVSGDQRFNGKWIMTTLYQIKKGRYHVPEKYRQQSRAQQLSNASNIASSTAEAKSSSSMPTSSKSTHKSFTRQISSTENVAEPTASYSASSSSRENVNSSEYEPDDTDVYFTAQRQIESEVKASEASASAKRHQSEESERARQRAVIEHQQSVQAEQQRRADEAYRSSVSVKKSSASRKATWKSHAKEVQTAYSSARAVAFSFAPHNQRIYIQKLSDAKNMGASPVQSKMINDYNHSDNIRHNAYVNGLDLMDKKPKGDPGYAYWYYNHAIPAKVVGYDGQIPIFGMDDNPENRSWLHKLTDPIIQGFKAHAPHTYEKFIGRRKAIRYYGEIRDFVYEPSISNYAYRGNAMGRPFRNHQANVFKRAWKGIESGFEAVIHPLRYYYNKQSKSASSASSASASVASARSASISSLNSTSTANVQEEQAMWRRFRSSISSSDLAWSKSYELTTPLGKYAKSAVSAGVNTMYSANAKVNTMAKNARSNSHSIINVINKYYPVQSYLRSHTSHYESQQRRIRAHQRSVALNRKINKNSRKMNKRNNTYGRSHDDGPDFTP